MDKEFYGTQKAENITPLTPVTYSQQRKESRLNLIRFKALKSHPISYWSVLAPLLLVSVVSYFGWVFIVYNIQSDFFSGMLSEQVALKWFWLFISISLVYLSLKTLIAGPISDFGKKDVKVFGIYFGNAALGTAAAYTGLIVGAISAHLTFGGLFQSSSEFWQFIKFGASHFGLLVVLYLFYITLLPGEVFRYRTLMEGKVFRLLLLLFFLSFCSGRALDVLNVFSPRLFG